MMNFLDLSAASEEERRIIREILSDTSVVNIEKTDSNSSSSATNEIVNNHPQQQQTATINSSQQQHQQQLNHQQANGQKQSFKSNPNQYVNYNTNAIIIHGNQSNNNVSLNHRSSYNNQRKNIHNTTSNNTNSIGNASGSNRNVRIPTTTNVANSINNNLQQQQQQPQQQLQHYPQQYTPPPPSNVPSLNHYYNLNANITNNSHNATQLNSQPQQQQPQQHHQHQQRTNEHSNERVRSGLSNHMSTSSDIKNIVVTSTSGLATVASPLDQHQHASALPQNVYNHHPAHMHSVPPVMPTAKPNPKSTNLKNQAYHTQDTSTTNMQSTTTGPQPVPPMAGDVNSVIGMDMAATQPSGYAIQPHVTAFAPPHHVYGGPPIFQPYHYLIPYNIPSYMPYVLPPNSVVPPRQQVPPQSNQQANATPSASSHSRHLPQQPQQQQQQQQQQSHEQINSVITSQTDRKPIKDEKGQLKDPKLLPQSQSLKKNSSEKDLSEPHKNSKTLGTSNNLQHESKSQKIEKVKKTQEAESALDAELAIDAAPQEQNIEVTNKIAPNIKPVIQKSGSVSATKNKNVVPSLHIDRNETQQQKSETDPAANQQGNSKTPAITRVTSNEAGTDIAKHQDFSSSSSQKRSCEDSLKEVSDEGFATQSSLDVSKQSQESSAHIDQSSLGLDNSRIKNEKTQDTSTGDSKSSDANTRASGAWGSASSKSWADLFKRGGASTIGPSLYGENEQIISGSENSDEDSEVQRSTVSRTDNAHKNTNPAVTMKEHRSQEAAKRALDKMAPRLAQKINSINLKHSLPFLRPRGFINKGNGCYINATLQALIACPPFYNLMKEVGDLRGSRRENSCTPILDSFAEFFLNFPPLDSNKKNKQSNSQDQKLGINQLQAEAIEPKCIYNVLGQIKSECLKGAQEDAEEFLSSVLNGLHEEMIGLGEVLNNAHDSNAQNGHPSDVEDSNDDVANDENLWREVGPKNRSLPIRTAKVVNTPIQEIFGGSLFSIRTAGKDRCGHRSPFFDLQLDISGDEVKSVQDAIKSFTATEIIHDFYCSKTKQKLDAQRRTSLDQLPPILILHLKQFVYTQDHGLRKLIKRIDYPIDFELPENCLHEKNSADKNLLTSRSYKLLAVVYHDGKEAIKGHYLTDVYHIGSGQWIRCDDSNLKVISSPRIDSPDSSRTPYLLFYRRLNTLRAQPGNYDNKKKS